MVSGLHQIESGARGLVGFWLREWEVLLSSVLASSRSNRSARLVIRPDDGEVAFVLMGPDGREIFEERCSYAECGREILDRLLRKASSSFRRPDISIVLSVSQAVTGSLFIPQQARAQAGKIIQQHLAGKMPVAMEELFLGFEIQASAAGKLELRYLAVPKERLSRCLERLSLKTSDINALQGPALASTLPATVPYEGAPMARAVWTRRIAGLLALVTVLAPTVGFGALAWRQNAVLAELEGQVAPLASRAAHSAEHLRTIYGMAGDLGRLAELRSGSSVVLIWEELARLLPDGTYLTEVEVKGREVHITGFSAAAPELIQSLEASEHLHEATLAGPVVFDRLQDKERFTLRAMTRKPRALTGEGE